MLSRRGRRMLGRVISDSGSDNYLAIVHDEASSLRFLSIVESQPLPYSLILYDLTNAALRESAYARLLNNAEVVFAISKPLEQVAKSLGAKQVQRIGFFRPPLAINGFAGNHDPNHVEILVLSYADPACVAELLNSLQGLIDSLQVETISVHFVGRHKFNDSLPGSERLRLIRHGIVSPGVRDEIAAGCDLAFLAGPCEDIADNPFSKYSLPSKLGDFLAAGLPTIARVAAGSAAQQTIVEYLSPFVQVATSEPELRLRLAGLLADLAGRQELSQMAFNYALNNVILPNAAKPFLAQLEAFNI